MTDKEYQKEIENFVNTALSIPKDNLYSNRLSTLVYIMKQVIRHYEQSKISPFELVLANLIPDNDSTKIQDYRYPQSCNLKFKEEKENIKGIQFMFV